MNDHRPPAIPPYSEGGSELTPGQLAQLACLLEVTARKPGNVHRQGDLPGLHFIEFLMSASAIVGPLDRAVEGIGASVEAAIAATRRLVSTNTNLGMVLLLSPLAAVPTDMDLREGIGTVLGATTVDDAKHVYRAIRLAKPGGMGKVADQDVGDEPTVSLRTAMELAAGKDMVARQYVNEFRQVLDEALPLLRQSLVAGKDIEIAIITTYLNLLSRYPDSLIARKRGIDQANEVSRRAALVVEAGWPDHEQGRHLCDAFDRWLREPSNRYNPGTTADLITATLYAALRDGTISLPIDPDSKGVSEIREG